MSAQITLEYLSKLLNKPITEEIEVTLSSAQKSRVHGWLIKNGISFNEPVLAQKFTVIELLRGGIAEGVSQPPSHSNVLSLASLDMGSLQIGIDIQRVDELFPQGLSSDPKADQELTQIFTVKELSYAQSKVDPAVTLTGIFCAKEAIQKTSNLAKNLNTIEVLPDESGKPKSNGYALSISHSGNYAIAIAINASVNPEIKLPLEVLKDSTPATEENCNLIVRQCFKMPRVIDLILLGLIGFLFMSKYYS